MKIADSPIDSRFMADFTRQREWAKGRGLFLVFAFFFGGLGGGLYLISLHLDYLIGQIIALLIVFVGKGGTHLAYLGRPLRFWRGFLRPNTSWISRGLATIAILGVFGLMQLAAQFPQFSWLPWDAHNPVIRGFAALGAIGLIAYTGFALGVIRAIPFWNTSLMPVLFMACSLLGGVGLAAGMAVVTGNSTLELLWLEALLRGLLIVVALLIGIFVWGSYTSLAGRQSVMDLVKGEAAPWFLGGVLILGVAIPLIVSISALFVHIPTVFLLLSCICELFGSFSLRYSILKAGIYAPLI